MAHRVQQDYIKSLRNKFRRHFIRKKVLEIGSLNINGTVRGFFRDCDFLGIDVGPGKDVDIICEGQEYDAPNNTFDTVISCECLEHNPYWLKTFINMHRMCKPGGLVIFTCATTGRPEHGTASHAPFASPLTIDKWDYYMNLTEANFTDSLFITDMFSEHEFSTVPRPYHDLQFYGVKKHNA